MSKTGTYVYRNGKMVKVSDETPKIASQIDGVYFPKNGKPYIENFGGAGRKAGAEVRSKGHKKAIMAEKGIAEFEESADYVRPEKEYRTKYSIPKSREAQTNTVI